MEDTLTLHIYLLQIFDFNAHFNPIPVMVSVALFSLAHYIKKLEEIREMELTNDSRNTIKAFHWWGILFFIFTTIVACLTVWQITRG